MILEARRVILEARKILVYTKVHEFFETEQNCSRCPIKQNYIASAPEIISVNSVVIAV